MKTAVLFVHGFMGSDAQFTAAAAAAEAAGGDTHLLTLPGHGAGVSEFARAARAEWQSAVDSELAALRTDYDRIIAVGHSMGGLLLINSAIDGGHAPDAILALALPLRISLTRRGIKLRMAAARPAVDGESPDITAARAMCGVGGVSALNSPRLIPNTAALLTMASRTRRRLAALKTPLTVINSLNDELVPPRVLGDVAAALPNATLIRLTDAGHFRYGEAENRLIETELARLIRGR